MLHTTEPVCDRSWWLRSAVYWVLLCFQEAASDRAGPVALWWAVMVVPCAVAVYVRDRCPWALALLGLGLTATMAQIPITLGTAAVAGRARLPLTVGYSAAGTFALLIPAHRYFSAGISATGPDPTGGLAVIALTVLVLIALPALIGTLRRTGREASLARLGFEAEQRELAAQQAVAAERNRIAQEMHDVLGHKLSLITMQAGALSVNADAGAETVERQAELVRQTARQALNELRGIIGVLDDRQRAPMHPRPGLAETLALVEHNQSSGLHIEVSNELPVAPLPAATGAALHRIVTEGLTNAHRHAKGAALSLRLSGAPGHSLLVELVNQPSAQGADDPGLGRGLPGLRERVRALDGTLDAAPTEEGGYRLAAQLPWLDTRGELR